MRIAVVTPIPTPYRDPLWSAVAAHPGVELDVYYCANDKSDRPWQVSWKRDFRYEALPGKNLAFDGRRRRGASCFWNPAVLRRLRERRHDAIIVGGYNHPTMLAAIGYAVARGVPYYLMSESHGINPRAGWKRAIKRVPVSWIVRHASGTFPTGTLASQYLRDYGAAHGGLHPIPNVPDIAALAQGAAELRPRRAELRRERGLDPHRPVVLFAGRLIPKKGVDTLLRAFHAVGAHETATLLLVGDGPMRAELEQTARDLGIATTVRFAGFAAPSEMLAWYGAADLFVLPSSETWGVVVLEAVACGLPIIVSDRVGCYPDVIVDPALGEVFPHGDATALGGAIQRRLARPSDPARADAVRHPLISQWRYDLLARRLIAALAGSVPHSVVPSPVPVC